MVVEGELDHHPQPAFSLSPGIDQALDKDNRDRRRGRTKYGESRATGNEQNGNDHTRERVLACPAAPATEERARPRRPKAPDARPPPRDPDPEEAAAAGTGTSSPEPAA